MKLDEFVSKHYDELNLNDLHIWRYIVNHKELCITMTIEEMAEKCNISRTSILRFAKKISLQGFSELKFYLKLDAAENNELNEERYKSITQDYIRGIQELNTQNLDKVCEALYESKRIFAYGSGVVQQSAVKELKRMLFKLDTIVYSINGSGELEHLMNNLEAGDVVVMISLSGDSKQIVHMAEKLQEKPCKIISITRLQHNVLSGLSDIQVYFSSMTQPIFIENHRFEPVIMFFFTVETIFLKYAMYRQKRHLEE